MNHLHRININLTEPFPNLPSAPIVEAVIHWQARASDALDSDSLLHHLKNKLPDYPHVKPQRRMQFQMQLEDPERSSVVQQDNWEGFRFESNDTRYIAQFTRNGFVFSRLEPYENWERFVAEAKRLWLMYIELARPSEIQRLGVRFINRIVPVKLDKLDDYLTAPPQSPSPLNLPVNQFLHRNTFDVPGYPYNINVIQTIQPMTTGQGDELGLILDIDVYTNNPIAIEEGEEALDDRLMQMRWLKNKAFFTFLTPSVIDQFKETGHE